MWKLGALFNEFKGFAKEALSESNGTGSFSRASAAAIVLSVLGWVWYIVLTTHAIPDLAGPTLFITGGSGATYGANKLASVVSQRNQDQASQNSGKGGNEQAEIRNQST